jgi:hypothetical protein
MSLNSPGGVHEIRGADLRGPERRYPVTAAA